MNFGSGNATPGSPNPFALVVFPAVVFVGPAPASSGNTSGPSAAVPDFVNNSPKVTPTATPTASNSVTATTLQQHTLFLLAALLSSNATYSEYST